ncbi:hypothetical protein ACQR1Y_18930 [Bradyrhizobium sp. HKCCYLRH3099]|uniref:hypothetical protein n=1 Tax=unclassified Bradyrhizobium TaxID=2631580 RepID=UPI003EB6AAEA
MLLSVAGKSGLELPPELLQGRQAAQLFRKRDLLFKKVGLDPNNQHHVAFLCAIVYDHLYLDKKSIADVVYGDDKDFDLLHRFMAFRKTSRLKRRSDLYRSFVKHDPLSQSEYGSDKSIDRLRMRLDRAAKKAITGNMKLTAKRRVRLEPLIAELRAVFDR